MEVSMAHTHNFETVRRMSITGEVRDLGIEGSELRVCNECECETVFLLVKGKWIAMSDEHAGSEKDILLA